MPGKRGRGGAGPKARTYEQQRGSAALIEVMHAWEELSDEERLTWDTQASTRRQTGVNFFKQVNLRRARRGEELTRLPAPAAQCESKPVLKGLVIQNPAGRITLKLQLFRVPTTPRTVWASLPCNRGLSRPSSCPRLGWLPPPRDGASDITILYFGKHGERIEKRGLPLVGKRIFVRLRQEMDEGPNLYEQVRAVVPPPRGRARR